MRAANRVSKQGVAHEKGVAQQFAHMFLQSHHRGRAQNLGRESSPIKHSFGMEDFRVFGKEKLGRQVGGVALYVSNWLESMEVCLEKDEDPAESLWVKIKGRAGTEVVTVRACSRSIRRVVQMKPSIGRKEWPHTCKLWSSHRISTT